MKRSSFRVVLLAILIAFSPVFFAKFVLFDDDLHIFRNANLALPFFQSLKTFWLESYRGFYIPMTYTFWSIVTHGTRWFTDIKTLEELSSFPFHVLNLITHVLNSYLVYRLLNKISRHERASLAGAFLFALHPIQVESVAWATGFKDLICGSFSLGALLVLFEFFERKVVRYAGFATVLFIFALLSKPSAIVVPLILFPIICLFKKEYAGAALRVAFVWLVLALPFAYLTSKLQPPMLLLDPTPFYLRPLIALDTVAFYLRKLVFPFELIQDYSRTPKWVLGSKGIYFMIPSFLLSVGFLCWRHQWKALAFLGVFALSFSPVLGLIPFSYQNFSTVADHYLYFPMVTVAIFAAILLTRFEISIRILKLSGIVLAGLTFFQSSRWLDTKRLLHYTLSINPWSIIAHNNLAVAYEMEGDLPTSLEHYRTASGINPRLNHHHYNIGNTLLKMGKIGEAQQAFEETLVVDPGYAEAYFSLGLIAEADKNYLRARDLFEQALELDPQLGKAGIKAGTTLVKLGKVDEGIARIKESIELDPRASAQGYFHLGRVYLVKKDFEGAKDAFQRSIFLSPDHTGAKEELAKLE